MIEFCVSRISANVSVFTTSIHPKLLSARLVRLAGRERGWVNGCVPAIASPTYLPGPRRLVRRSVNTLLYAVGAFSDTLSK